MNIEYDNRERTAYIQLADREIAESVECSPYCIVDLDDEGRPVGIEIIDAPEDVFAIIQYQKWP